MYPCLSIAERREQLRSVWRQCEVIDTTLETLIPFTQAAGQLPRRRAGRKTNISTLYRWSQAGCRGVVLESIQCGGNRCTSPEALQRFFERLTQAQETGHIRGGGPSPAPVLRSATRRQRDSDRAGRQL